MPKSTSELIGEIVGELEDENHQLRIELAATCRELERWKRGTQVEGDYICQNGDVVGDGSTREELSDAAWLSARDKGSPDTTHPCDDHPAEKCMCKGACSCHYITKATD